MDKGKIALIVVLAIGLAIILGVFLKKKKESPLSLENCKKDFPCAVCGTPLSQENCSRNFPCTVCGTPLNRENCMRDFPCSTGTTCPTPANEINCGPYNTIDTCRNSFKGATGCNELNSTTCGPYNTLDTCRNSFKGPTGCNELNSTTCGPYNTLDTCRNSFTGPTGCNVLNIENCVPYCGKAKETVTVQAPALSVGSRVFYSYYPSTDDVKLDLTIMEQTKDEATKLYCQQNPVSVKCTNTSFFIEKDKLTIYGVVTNISGDYCTVEPYIIKVTVDCSDPARQICKELSNNNEPELARSRNSNNFSLISTLPSISNHLTVPLPMVTKADIATEDKINKEIYYTPPTPCPVCVCTPTTSGGPIIQIGSIVTYNYSYPLADSPLCADTPEDTITIVGIVKNIVDDIANIIPQTITVKGPTTVSGRCSGKNTFFTRFIDINSDFFNAPDSTYTYKDWIYTVFGDDVNVPKLIQVITNPYLDQLKLVGNIPV